VRNANDAVVVEGFPGRGDAFSGPDPGSPGPPRPRRGRPDPGGPAQTPAGPAALLGPRPPGQLRPPPRCSLGPRLQGPRGASRGRRPRLPLPDPCPQLLRRGCQRECKRFWTRPATFVGFTIRLAWSPSVSWQPQCFGKGESATAGMHGQFHLACFALCVRDDRSPHAGGRPRKDLASGSRRFDIRGPATCLLIDPSG
jgi:hypothetical protein